MFFDTHAHYDDEWFDEDREELLALLPDAGIDYIVNLGCEQKTDEASIALAEKYDYIYAAVGWHPHDARSWTEESADQIRRWSHNPKVVAIGEVGLDYHYDAEWKDVQISVLEKQFQLAEELDLPIVIHDREAHGDCMDIVRKYPNVRGEFHCYSGSAEMAKELLNRGWYLGFNGSITLSGVRRAKETLQIMPSDRLLLETDSPYLAPLPRLDGKRNDSRKLVRIAEVIAEILHTTPELVAETARENALRFFDIGNIHR